MAVSNCDIKFIVITYHSDNIMNVRQGNILRIRKKILVVIYYYNKYLLLKYKHIELSHDIK